MKDSQNHIDNAYILLIEDNSIDVLVISRMIRYLQDNLDIKSIRQGLAAVQFLKSADSLPEFIIMDLRMPLMDGFELTKILAENKVWSKIPLFAISAIIDEEESQRLNEIHQNITVMQKPITFEKINAMIQIANR